MTGTGSEIVKTRESELVHPLAVVMVKVAIVIQLGEVNRVGFCKLEVETPLLKKSQFQAVGEVKDASEKLTGVPAQNGAGDGAFMAAVTGTGTLIATVSVQVACVPPGSEIINWILCDPALNN